MPIIEVKNLVKEYNISVKKEGLRGAILNLFNPKYRTKVAVNNIDFSIEEGETVGYIGANGAGKSTTIKMLTGILTPTMGEVIVNGLIPHKSRKKNNLNIAAVFGQRTQLWWDIPVVESYKLLQKIYEVPNEVYKRNLEKFTNLLDLEELLKIPVRQLSLGQKMRCEIAAAFLHEPKIVYLDEPTIGLDVVVKEKIREFIKVLNKENNTTVILTTHDLQDIEEVCRRIIIIDNGTIKFDGSIDEIKNQFGKYRVGQFKVRDVRDEIVGAFDRMECLELLLNENNEIHVKFDRKNITAAGVMEVISSYCEILDLSIKEPSIESIVKDLYRK